MGKKLNVGIFTYDFYPYIGGQGRHVYELYQENQKEKKINLYIFSPIKSSLENCYQLSGDAHYSRFKNIGLSLNMYSRINKAISDKRLDLVHIHGGPGGIFLLKKLHVPTIFTAHHTYWQQFYYIKTQIWKYGFFHLEKRSYNNADKIICVSHDTKKVLEKNYHLQESKLIYIPNGVRVKNSNLIKSSKKNQILYVGRIDKRKGVDFLINAMSEINSIQPNIKLHIVGEGSDKKRLEKLVYKRKLNVIFHGFLSDNQLIKLYSDMSLQVVPSRFEGFGITVLEAIEKKTPVVATNVEGIRTIITDNKNGILVNYGEEKELAKKIIELVNDERRRSKLAEAAYRELGEYDWNSILKKTIQTYESIVN